MGEAMDDFNQKLRKKTENFLPRNVLIIFSEYQKDQNDTMMAHVKGIVANYFRGAKKLLILEKLRTGVNFSARNLSEKGFLKIIGHLFNAFSIKDLSSGRKLYGWKPAKKEGGGSIFDPRPFIDKNCFSERSTSFLSQKDWLIVTIHDQVLWENAKIVVETSKE
jgi:hypothetical protein